MELSSSTVALASQRGLAAYSKALNGLNALAGKDSKVKAVATTKPPMIAIAIGPQNRLRVSGIMASIAAAAVRAIGRILCTVAIAIASQIGVPCPRSSSIWSIKITELR